MTTATLESLCAINPETLNGATPPDFEFRYLDISVVTKGKIDWAATQNWTFADAPSRARRQLRPGDTLLCTVRPGLQAHARITSESPQPLVGSTGFAALRPHLPTDAGFVFQQLFSNAVAAQLRAMETGSSYPAVNEGDVRRLRVYCPNPEERQRIATVLDTVDEATGKTEQVIAKLKQVRAGLLHDLLTHGLDEHGQLRDPLAHPEQFQDSPIGLIPIDWEPNTLGAWADFRSGYAFKNQELADFGWKVVRITNLHRSDFPFWYYDGPVRDSWVVDDGDLLFSWAGVASSIDAYLYRGEKALLNQHIYNLRIVSLEERYFVFTFLQYLLPQLRRSIDGGAGQLHLSKEKIERIFIPRPKPDELNAIVKLVKSIDTMLKQETTTLSKLESLKSGLMTDLLTGRVSMSADLLGEIA